MIEVPKPPKPQNKIKENLFKIAIFFLSISIIYISGYIVGSVENNTQLNAIPIEDIENINLSQIENSEKEIFIDGIVLEVLNLDFQSHTTEYKLCLMGEIKDNKYLITKIYPARIIYANETRVQAYRCPKNTLIELHNHPIGSCRLSNTDKESYENFYDGIRLDAVQCGVNNFGFYRYNQYKKRLEWGILEKS